MRRLSQVLTLLVVVLFVGRCFANNSFFLPGDACFHTSLTKVQIESLKKAKTGERTFGYAIMVNHGGGYFCGFAGYMNATIPAVDDKFMTNLEDCYKKIRQHYPRELVEQAIDAETDVVETNGINLVFYPADFDLEKHVIGLQYNENWIDEVVKFGHEREHCLLNSQVDDAEAVAEAWRDSPKVPELKVTLPAKKAIVEDEESSERDETLRETRPVTVRGKVKAVVLGNATPTDLYRGDPEGGDRSFTVYVVDSEGITEHRVSSGRIRAGRTDDVE